MVFLRVLGLAAVLFGCAAPGTTPGATGASSSARDAAALRIAQAMLARGGCPAARPSIVDEPLPMGDPAFPGALRQMVLAEGCGGRGLLNVMILPTPGGGARLSPLFPGTTVAEPSLQRDGLRQAMIAVKAVAPGCDRITVHDTRFQGPAEPASRNGRIAEPWTETWTLGACGRGLAVPMRFEPNAGGTLVVTSPNDIRRLD